jgi:hypothetical protein
LRENEVWAFVYAGLRTKLQHILRGEVIMSMEIFQKVREMGKELKEKRRNEEIDYNYMTAPCGLPCFECYLYLAQFDQGMAETIAGLFNLSPDEIKCKGCRGENGKCAHHPMECRVY